MSDAFFVAADWLAEHLNDAQLQIIDARMLSPGQELSRDIHEEYRQAHLPGAVFFDIEMLSDHTTALPHMMPRAETFAVAMRELGISNDKHLIVYDEGSLFSAPRAWWMLRTFGVERVSILAGGLAAWQAAGLPTEEGDSWPADSEFEVKPDTSVIRNLTDVLLTSHEKTAQIVDARPAPRFNAEVDEPRPGLKRGHIPGSVNVPWNALVINGMLKTTDELTEIFQRSGVDLNRPVIASCGSGVTAAVVVLALTTLGVSDVTLYDGSWSEWGSRSDTPIA